MVAMIDVYMCRTHQFIAPDWPGDATCYGNIWDDGNQYTRTRPSPSRSIHQVFECDDIHYSSWVDRQEESRSSSEFVDKFNGPRSRLNELAWETERMAENIKEVVNMLNGANAAAEARLQTLVNEIEAGYPG